MTTHHLAEGLMQVTKSHCHNHCTTALSLPQGLLCRMTKGTQTDIRMSTLEHIQRKTGVPADTLMSWYRLPADAVLGRIKEPK